MLPYFTRLFTYDAWANREVLRALGAIGAPPERSVKLAAHIAAAERLWLDRLMRRRQSMAVWPVLTLEQCQTVMGEMAAAWSQYLDTRRSAGLAEEVAYTNTKGEPWRSSVQDVLTHVVMHSAYHRAQIAADVRAAGHEPPYTDFIEAARRGFLDAEHPERTLRSQEVPRA